MVSAHGYKTPYPWSRLDGTINAVSRVNRRYLSTLIHMSVYADTVHSATSMYPIILHAIFP